MMKAMVATAASLALLAGAAFAQEEKKDMGMKGMEKKHGEMHGKMQEKMKGKHGAAKKAEPAKKDEHKH
jgi:hypothetical protein